MFLSHTIPQRLKQQLASLFKAAWRVIFSAYDILKYTFTYPWRDSYFAVARTVTDPERYLEQWVKVRQAEYSFIGLVGSVVSAVVAQMLQTLQLFQSPWTAPAALFISLFLSSMAVIIALHHTTFLNCVSFHPSLDAKLRRIFQLPPINSDGKNRLWSRRVWLGTLLYSMPGVLLSHSIICAFIGVGLIAVSPLWTRLDDVWDGPQKTACASIAGLCAAVLAYFSGVLYQYTPEAAEEMFGNTT